MTKIKIPMFLQELHGEETSLLSIVMTYLTGIVFGMFMYVYSEDLSVYWHKILLAILGLDIGGGVVANMSHNTSSYYAQRPKARWVFIVLHMLHPLLLWMVYPARTEILVLGATILIFTSIVNVISKETVQRLMAGVFLVLTFMLFLFFKMDHLLLILLAIYSIKLIMGFAVRWNSGQEVPDLNMIPKE
jgi:hypothetical protein